MKPSTPMRTPRRNLLMSALATLGIALLGIPLSAQAQEAAVVIPAPLIDEKPGTEKTETAVFAGGCFWGVQGVFQRVKGVRMVVSGYAGGDAKTARYKLIGNGDTGHAESVKISYNPKEISYGQLLQIFFSVAHNPTQLNRQGPDVGSQYRSAIFTSNDEQKRIAETYIAQLDKAKVFPKPIVTQITALPAFYPAEDYHQDYLTLNPTQPYIAIHDLPKIDNLKRLFGDRYRSRPVLVNGQS